GRERERLCDLRPDVADTLARNPADELTAQLARQQLPGGLSFLFVEARRAVVDEYGEGRVCLAQEAKEGATFLQVLRQFVDVDDGYDERRREDGNVARAFVLRDEGVERLGAEGVERALIGRPVVKLPELLRDVPGHHEVATGERGPTPERGHRRGRRIFLEERRERRPLLRPIAEDALRGERRFPAANGFEVEIVGD